MHVIFPNKAGLYYIIGTINPTSNLRSGVLAGYPTTSPHPQGKAPWGRGWLSTRRVWPFLDLSRVRRDFHARSRFARSTIAEEKWGTTRTLICEHATLVNGHQTTFIIQSLVLSGVSLHVSA